MSRTDELVPERAAINEACKAIISASNTTTAVNYAVGYAAELRRMLAKDDPDNAIHIQCLYVLNNIQHWRGDAAKTARNALKAFTNAK